MFSYIIGDVKILKEDYIVLENNNIGYKIFMSQRSISTFIKNETVKIYTEFVVREDSVTLYGFVDVDELEMFLNLMGVSGVGPKAALSVLSTLSVYDLKRAIVSNYPNTITLAQGIGKKTASRIILELTDKVDLDVLDTGEKIVTQVSNKKSENYEVVFEALSNLGYNKVDIEKVIKDIDLDNMELSDIIKTALKRM